MNNSMKDAVIKLFVKVLPLMGTMDERMKMLEDFDEIYGAGIPDWEERMKDKLGEIGSEKAREAIAAVDAFHAKYHVYDANGNKVYERTRIGDEYHQIVVTYDSSAPNGQEITVREVPNIERMTLDQLQVYHEELHSALDELSDEEPEDEDSEEYDFWENRYSELEDLVEEVAERLEEMGGDV